MTDEQVDRLREKWRRDLRESKERELGQVRRKLLGGKCGTRKLAQTLRK